MEGKSQETAAAMARMSVRSARKWQDGPLPSETKRERGWRTRPDPFEGVWEEEIEPLLRGDPEGKLKSTTIIEWLEEHHPGRFSASQLRTLQRRLQDWRALHGPEREVYFPQEHPPGREAQHGLHPRQLPWGYHRWPALPPPAVSADPQPLGLALRRDRHRRDLPGPQAGIAERPVGPGRRSPGGAQRQHLGRHPRDAPQPRPDPERQLRRPAGPLRACAPPASTRGIRATRTAWPSRATTVSRMPSTRRCSCGAAAISTLPTTTPSSWVKDGPETQPTGGGEAGAGNTLPGAPAANSPAGIRQLPVPGSASGAPSR